MSDKWYLKYKTIKYSEDGKIYLPYNNCEWVGKPKVSSVIIVRMSCGGGMGGSCWNEYLLDKEIKEGINNYTRIDGIKVALNSKYVVRVIYGKHIVKAYYQYYEWTGKDENEQELVVLSETKNAELYDECKTLREVYE